MIYFSLFFFNFFFLLAFVPFILLMNKTVYSVHKFVAENVDEISFNVGEKIMILEKDEGYNDGWWKVQEIGRLSILSS